MKRSLPFARAFRAQKALERRYSISATKVQPSRLSEFPPSLAKRIALSRYLTVRTLPTDSKAAVLEILRRTLWKATDSEKGWRGRQPAAVVLASPRHAEWLADTHFLENMVLHLQRPLHWHSFDNFHLLAAVVDGLPGFESDGVLHEGLSIARGFQDELLPGLWDDTLESASSSSSTAPSSLQISYDLSSSLESTSKHPETSFHLTLPLANTLFQTGRRSTLLASEWNVNHSGSPAVSSRRIQAKADQKITLKSSRLEIYCRLDPITQPRVVHDTLGNIISKLEIDGNPTPASAELQKEIPLWLENKKRHSPTETRPGAVSVWALVTSREQFEDDHDVENNWPEAANDNVLARYEQWLGETHNTSGDSSLGYLIQRGSRLFRVLSGGGEWGAKAALLSLDPQTEYSTPSEAESLRAFQSSFFQGDTKTAGPTANPGDIIQFFVESTSAQEGAREFEDLQTRQKESSWVTRWGTGQVNEELRDEQLRKRRSNVLPEVHNIFGAFSTEAVYLSLPSTTRIKSKLDVPGSFVTLDHFYKVLE